jgi:sirohydrochlorin ferrochelatase
MNKPDEPVNALLLVAHGSRRQQSNDEVATLAAQISRACNGDYPIVHCGFLELATPSIPEGIEKCISDGASQITLLPYFLNSGRHVVDDVPEIVAASREQHAGVDIRIAPHLGASALMVDLLIASAQSVSLAD